MLKRIKKNKWLYLTWIAFFCLLFMHMYRLTEVPYGLNVDEASGAYDAMNIARYGVDRYLKSYPVYFTNYGDGQNALYIYMTVLLFKIFGISKWTIRATAVIGAVLMGCFGYKYMEKSQPDRQGKVIWLCLYAILPIFTMTQRFGLESHLMLPMLLISAYFVSRAMDSGKWIHYLAAGMMSGITLYTYALSYIVLPIFLIFCLVYGAWIRKICWRKAIGMFLILIFFATPLILVQLVNFFDLPEMYIGPFTITKMLSYRIDEIEGNSIGQNIISIFRSSLIYDNLRYNTIPKYGVMFYISIPFIFIGLFRVISKGYISIKTKEFSYAVPMFFLFLGEWIMGLTLSGHSVPNSTRMIGIYAPLLYFLVEGLYWIWDILRNKTVRNYYVFGMVTCYLIGFISFASYYFTAYNRESFPLNWLFYETYDEVKDYMEKNKEQEWMQRTTCYPWNYIYYLLEYEISPYDFNLPENGLETYEKDDINEYPEFIPIEANYVVYRTDQGSLDYLKEIGYKGFSTGDNFIVMVSPLDNYTESIEQNIQLTIDNFYIDNNQIILSGWCVDQERQSCFSNIVLVADSEEYNIELVEREDVAAHLGSDKYINSGFRGLIPYDIFSTKTEIRLIGISEEGTRQNLISWSRKE